ncbi:MAG TPA: ankyrin repeat domain-containing protein, partial [Candidatus Ozemobacteraceae bacterium]|nr:ankyrin repeat domain-containing protein [Candidatus Ozemobacteraceae bacterium]
YLLKKGVPVNASFTTGVGHGYTPLHAAAAAPYPDFAAKEVIELLLTNGASLEERPIGGSTPLQEAAKSGSLDNLTTLLERGADPLVTDASGATVLHYLVSPLSRTSTASVDLLLARGVPIDAATRDGKTPLFLAVSAGNRELAEHLLRKGASAAVVTGDGENLFHAMAAGYDFNPELFETLLAKGVSSSAKNRQGETPLALAQKNGFSQRAYQHFLKKGFVP